MSRRPETQSRDAISFGAFILIPSERLLTKDGITMELGSRTLDALIALVSRPNEAIAKKELMARVWPDVIVEESSLRFHIASLRKALGDGKNGARYIATLSGRGYCFVAPVSRSRRGNAPDVAAANFPHANLPGRLSRMVGRTDDVALLSSQLTVARFVTIVGGGGIGKTSVAVAVAHDLSIAFDGAVLFVDIGAINDPKVLATSLASMLGLSVQSDDATPSLVAYLSDRRILLILDTCEHLIDAVADLAACIFVAAPQVFILATSREALRVEGEHIYNLATLTYPPESLHPTVANIQSFSAVQLFMERAAASGAQLDLSDADAAVVASICRELGGVALAIELAARRVGAHGLHQIAALLDQRLGLLWQGQRTAPPRQKTLRATLDWSFDLLSELERVVLRRLAVFVGPFTLDAVRAVANGNKSDEALIVGAIDSLVAKSMVATRPIGPMMRYQLMDTMHAYLLDVACDDPELYDVAARHALYYRGWLEQTDVEWRSSTMVWTRTDTIAALGNVRAALEWCFGVNGDTRIGIELACAAAPVFLSLSLLAECHRWSERAILALTDEALGSIEEMHLQAALGMALMLTHGNSDTAHVALNRSLAISEERGDVFIQLQLLGPLHLFEARIGEFNAALRYARRISALSATIDDPAAVALAHSLLGYSLHFAGELDLARVELEAALRQDLGRQISHQSYSKMGVTRNRTLAAPIHALASSAAASALARTLWIQGHPAQAVERVRQTVRDASRVDHPVTLLVALTWAVSVFLWTGDLQAAGEHIDRFISHAESYSLRPDFAVGRGFKGELAICRGDAKNGVKSLQICLEELHAARYELLTTPFNISLVQGLAATGRFAEGSKLIDENIRQVEANGDLAYMPELLRVKGRLLLSMPRPDGKSAELYFRQSLELSRRQAARAWELRTAVDLAGLWASQGQIDMARGLVQPVFGQFSEGFDTTDLKAAQNLLDLLG